MATSEASDPLAHTKPGLAKKVLEFDVPQLVALSAFVLQAQALVGMSGVPVQQTT